MTELTATTSTCLIVVVPDEVVEVVNSVEEDMILLRGNESSHTSKTTISILTTAHSKNETGCQSGPRFEPPQGTRNASSAQTVSQSVSSTSGIKFDKCEPKPANRSCCQLTAHADASVAGSKFPTC